MNAEQFCLLYAEYAMCVCVCVKDFPNNKIYIPENTLRNEMFSTRAKSGLSRKMNYDDIRLTLILRNSSIV